MGNGEKVNALRDARIIREVDTCECGPMTRAQGYCDCGSLGELLYRKFDTGATRDVEDGKLDYEGFLSPLVLARFANYMHKHRIQKDGSLRDSDNWQKGIPRDAYMKSMWRHFMDVWLDHRVYGQVDQVGMEDELCAVLFNVQGYLHELLVGR